ncbi:MAG: hypothetical protein JKY17_09420 [Magnetovibrio sp.]|nr:hypothetical protein [Magnetovibrio sp.]
MSGLKIRALMRLVILVGLFLPFFAHADNHEYKQILEWDTYDYRFKKFKWPKHWPKPNLKKYKTYPDIWGWHIPHLETDLYDGRIYDIGVDERIVYYIVREQDKNNPGEVKYRHYFQELFRGKKWEITEDEKWELYQNNTFGRHQGSRYSRYTYEEGLPHGWEIKDGGGWEVYRYPNIAHHINIPYMTLKKGGNAKEEKKLFVRILDHQKNCDLDPFQVRKLIIRGDLFFIHLLYATALF